MQMQARDIEHVIALCTEQRVEQRACIVEWHYFSSLGCFFLLLSSTISSLFWAHESVFRNDTETAHTQNKWFCATFNLGIFAL